MDAVLQSGVTAHVACCPVAGAVIERAELHARDHTLLVEIPMWGGYDTPGRLVHLERATVLEDVRGPVGGDPVVLGGFYGEYEAFFESLAAGHPPRPSLDEVRQSVEVAEAVRARREEWRS
jgi:predicted dehydrogenase